MLIYCSQGLFRKGGYNTTQNLYWVINMVNRKAHEAHIYAITTAYKSGDQRRVCCWVP